MFIREDWSIHVNANRSKRNLVLRRIGGINQVWWNGKVSAAGIKRAQILIEAVQDSVGLEGREVARCEIWVLVNDYITKEE